MDPVDKSYIIIGKIGSSYGVHGWLKITAYTEFSDGILDYHPWYIKQGDAPFRIFQIEATKAHGHGTIVKLAGIDTPETARLLTGSPIAIKRAQLPKLKENEYYWADLIGLTVIDQHGRNLGTVTDLIATGSNDVLIIKGEKEIAIPYFLGSVVLQIDLEKHLLLVDWELE